MMPVNRFHPLKDELPGNDTDIQYIKDKVELDVHEQPIFYGNRPGTGSQRHGLYVPESHGGRCGGKKRRDCGQGLAPESRRSPCRDPCH